jgi:phosphatidylserine/phosphatidylglycerophosphate/cardiolipin synthase-like enzyme
MEYEPLPIISKDFPKVVIPLIDSAVFSIDIIVYDWRFYRNDVASPVSLFNQSIARACSRGVIVRCLVQNDSVIDELKKLGCNAKKIHSSKLLHTKLMIIDKVNVIMGSHNYTQNAFSSNEEASIYVIMRDENNGLVQYFNNLFGIYG